MMKNVKKVKKTKKSKDIDKMLPRELRSIMIETKNSPEKKSSTRLLLEMRYGK